MPPTTPPIATRGHLPPPDVVSLLALLADAALWVMADQSVAYGNPAAFRVIDPEGAAALRVADLQALVALVPAHAFADARDRGAWRGDVADPASGPASVAVHWRPFSPDAAEDGWLLLWRPSRDRSGQSPGQDQTLSLARTAPLGRLAAGMVHDVNNPIGYIHSNLSLLQENVQALFDLVAAYEQHVRAHGNAGHGDLERIDAMRRDIDVEFLATDVPAMLAESLQGADAIIEIMRRWRELARNPASDPWQRADLEEILDEAVAAVWSTIKYKVVVERHFAGLPAVDCSASDIRLALVALLQSADDAIAERGKLVLRTGHDDGEAWVSVEDDGKPMGAAGSPRVSGSSGPSGAGPGTMLWLVNAIAIRHRGRLDVSPMPGRGNVRRLVLPIRSSVVDASASSEDPPG